MDTEVKVPERPSSLPEMDSEFVIIPPVSHPGKYLYKGELIFCVDIGDVILEVEAPEAGMLLSMEVKPGQKVEPNQVVAHFDKSHPEPIKSKIFHGFSLGHFLSGALGAVVVLGIYAIWSNEL
ncbi:hypothetical protein [Maricurvus nonylphenolicus]|uniref:hypothetical protein n=1 Tax=Maricurvus nonylphenolicus TaxID=1008307 RepID=UPI0036F42212